MSKKHLKNSKAIDTMETIKHDQEEVRSYKKSGREPYQRVIDNINEFTGRRWLLPEIVDWFQNTDKRFFILTGFPGTGKSAIAAWLAGYGSDDDNNRLLAHIRSLVKAAHFTKNNDSSTVKNLAQNVAEQLSQNVEGFGQILLSIESKATFILNNKMGIGHVEELNFFKNCDFTINSPDPVDIFNSMLREPLTKLYVEQGYNDPILIIVDGLDEESKGAEAISSMLGSLSNNPIFPSKVRFLITTNLETTVLQHFRNEDQFDLATTKTRLERTDDIKDYIKTKLARAVIDPTQVAEFANKISTAAKGNFLYADILVKDLLGRPAEINSLKKGELPEGLYELYGIFLKRLFGDKRTDWIETYSKLLGLLAIQQGEGFYGWQLEEITSIDINNIELIKQFVDGNYDYSSGKPEGPFHIFHKSFSDFLLGKGNNEYYHIDPVSMHQKVVDHYLKDGTKAKEVESIDWSNKLSYPLLHLAYHLNEIVEGIWIWIQQQTVRNDHVIYRQNREQSYRRILYKLARSKGFRNAQKKRFPGDNLAILSTTEMAICAAAAADDAPAIAEFVIKHAKIMSEIKRESPLQILRNTRDLEKALNSADLYDVEIYPIWYLLLAWELKDRDDLEGSRMIVKRMSERELVRLPRFLDPIAELIMQEILDINKKTLGMICGALIGEAKASQFYIRSRDLETALEIAKRAKSIEAISAIAELQAKLGDFGTALQTIKCIKRDDFRSLNFTMIAELQLQVDRNSAKGTLEAALRAAHKIEDDNFKAQALSYVAEIQLQIEKDIGKSTFDAAIQAARNITPDHFKPNPLIMVAELQAKSGDFDAALETAESIEDAHSRSQALLSIAELQLPVDRDSAKNILDVCLQTIENVAFNWDRIGVLSRLAELQAKSGDFDAALQTIEGLENEQERLTQFNKIVRYHVESGALTAALRMAKKFKILPYRAQALSTVSELLAESGHLGVGLETAKSIEDSYGRSHALTKIAELQLPVDRDSAKNILDAALRAAKSIPLSINLSILRSLAFTKIAELQAKSGDFAAALHAAEGYPDALTKTSELQARNGDISAALMTAGKIGNNNFRSRAFSKIALIQSQVDERGARKTFGTALQTAKNIGSELERSSLLIEIAELQAESGDFAAALQTANTIKDQRESSQVLARIAELQAESGDFAAALQTANTIKDQRESSQVLARIAELQAESGDFAAALQTANDVEGVIDRSEALTMIAELQSQFDMAGAKSTIDTTLQTTVIIENVYDRSEALQKVAELQAKLGDFESSIDTSKAILVERSTHLYNILITMIRTGDREQFKKLLDSYGQDLQTAYQILGLLFEIYKDQSKSLTETIRYLIRYYQA